MKYGQTQGLEEDKFRRLTGLKRTSFEKMIALLINVNMKNMVKQDHAFIKKITRPMLGFNAMHSARATLDGIELHHMLRKGQHINSKNQSVIEQFYVLAA